MAVFADVMKSIDAETITSVYTDSSTPANTFAATIKSLGIVRTYLFAGALEDPNAPVLGRVDLVRNYTKLAFRGSGLMGGTPLNSNSTYDELFQAML